MQKEQGVWKNILGRRQMASYADLLRKKVEQEINRKTNFVKDIISRSNAYRESLGLGDTALHILMDEQMNAEDIEYFEEDFSNESDAENRGIHTISSSTIPGFLDIEVDGEKFRLVSDILDRLIDVAKCSPYVIMAVCVSNNDLNHALRTQMFYLNLVPEEWHKKIVEHLKNHKIDLMED